ncbi:MAG: ABC transporter ATP-binding protein [Agathobacter sp.]|nr:ABC transporter ATP-binding protein [Agathobacter sp.]
MTPSSDRRKGGRKMVRKVLRYIKKYIPLLVISILLATVTVAMTLYFPILTGNALDLIIETGNVDFAGLVEIIKKAVVVILVSAIAQWIMNVCNNRMTYHIVMDIRKDAFQKLEKLPLGYIDSKSHGDIVSRVIADVDTFAEGLLMGFTQLFSGVATIVGTLLFMLSLDFKITLVVVVITPVSLLVASFIAKKTYAMFQLQSKTKGEQTALINEMIENQKVVQAFSHEDEVQEEFEEINNRLAKYSLNATFFSSLVNPSTRFVNSLVYAAVGIFGALSAISGGISVGQLACFLTYANQYTKPFNEISGVLTELQNALACAARIFELIEAEAEVPDAEDAYELEQASGKVSIEHVNFSYTAEQKLIEDFNLQVEPGQRVAIVGPTGCGKTTFINLLMRFYDVNSGSISLGECAVGDSAKMHVVKEERMHDIVSITRKSLRNNYGMVLQETWLKKGTIRENICMGKPDATEDEMIAAAKAAHAHSFIKRLPQGYDTPILEDGGNLSQGQKQLLCIARVMLCLPPMLILDEATSSIDTRTEMKIQKAFLTMMEGRTSFIVAHRLSTIREADVILVMKEGKIIEQGTHDELLAKDGFYATLYNSQFATV